MLLRKGVFFGCERKWVKIVIIRDDENKILCWENEVNKKYMMIVKYEENDDEIKNT